MWFDLLVAGDCDLPLGMENGDVADEAITASSSYVPNVGPQNGRWVFFPIAIFPFFPTCQRPITL